MPSPTNSRAVSTAAPRARSPRHVQQQEEATAPREYRLTEEQKQRLEDMREERELAGTRAWTQRPYGGHTDQELIRLIATGPVDARREDRDAAAAEEAAAALLMQIEDAAAAGGTTPGRIEVAPIYALLDQADEHLSVARAEQARKTEAAKVAAAADEHLRHLALSDDKSRLALRMAGTSRKEHTQLTKQAEKDRDAGHRARFNAPASKSREAASMYRAVADDARPVVPPPAPSPVTRTRLGRLSLGPPSTFYIRRSSPDAAPRSERPPHPAPAPAIALWKRLSPGRTHWGQWVRPGLSGV